jgi:hypothetical protein
MFALTPNNLTDVPSFEIDFMKTIPTTWDETVFIDGYPGKYCILARRHNDKWYVAGINALEEPIEVEVELPMITGKRVVCYGDDGKRQSYKKELKVKKSGVYKLTIQADGGIILTDM